MIVAAVRVMVRDGVGMPRDARLPLKRTCPWGLRLPLTSREKLPQVAITRLTDTSVATARKVFAAETDLGSLIANSLSSFRQGAEILLAEAKGQRCSRAETERPPAPHLPEPGPVGLLHLVPGSQVDQVPAHGLSNSSSTTVRWRAIREIRKTVRSSSYRQRGEGVRDCA